MHISPYHIPYNSCIVHNNFGKMGPLYEVDEMQSPLKTIQSNKPARELEKLEKPE